MLTGSDFSKVTALSSQFSDSRWEIRVVVGTKQHLVAFLLPPAMKVPPSEDFISTGWGRCAARCQHPSAEAGWEATRISNAYQVFSGLN